MCFLDSVYKTFIISTIVDIWRQQELLMVYKTFIISTIVDFAICGIILLSIRHL